MNLGLVEEKDAYQHFLRSIKGKLILFGASNAGKYAYECLIKEGITVDFFCDNDKSKSGEIYCGLEILDVDNLKKFNKKEVTILITSMYFREIQEQLYELGFENNYYIYSLGYDSGYYSVDRIIENSKKISELYNILNDELSKKTVQNLLNWRKTQEYKWIEEVCIDNQYFQEDIVGLNEKEVFIDAGAYNGDTIEMFIKKVNNKFEQIYAFEPDKTNYEKIERNLEEYIFNQKVKVYKVGLSDKEATLKFISDKGISSRIDENGTEFIKTIDLDSLFSNTDAKRMKDMYIKMDIEGEELKALKGARRLIKNNKPKLAICIYHKSEHLWSIPLFIKRLNPEYKIYIRHHSNRVGETVCYAV